MSLHKVTIIESGTGKVVVTWCRGGDTIRIGGAGEGSIEVIFDKCPDDLEAEARAKAQFAAVMN
jgi:hypothetical protein